MSDEPLILTDDDRDLILTVRRERAKRLATACACGDPLSLHAIEPSGRRGECWAPYGNTYCGCAFFREADRAGE